jgi:transcriptional regulator with XRE-family HTH domain
MDTFGERLKTLRKEKRLTQGQLAEKLGLDQSTISYYEKDKKAPELENLEKMALFFEVKIDDLWRGTSLSAPNAAKDIERVSKEIKSPLITPNDLKSKFKLVLDDGSEATDDEIEEAVRYILIQRMMNENKDK